MNGEKKRPKKAKKIIYWNWNVNGSVFFSSSIFYRLFSMQFVRSTVPYAHIIKRKRTFFFSKGKISIWWCEWSERNGNPAQRSSSFILLWNDCFVDGTNESKHTYINRIHTQMAYDHRQSTNTKSKLNFVPGVKTKVLHELMRTSSLSSEWTLFLGSTNAVWSKTNRKNSKIK